MSANTRSDSKRRRALAFLRSNRDQLVVDAVVMFTWIVASSVLFRELSLPRWLHLMVLFVGVVVYSRLTPNWERPPGTAD